MKKCIAIIAVLALMISLFSSCTSKENYTESIYERIHRNFYDIKSYSAKCTITIHAKEDHIYNAEMSYNDADETYKLVYDDIQINISDSKATVTKGNSVLKTVACDSFMPIFINRFFEKYYTGEESSVNTSSSKSFGTTTIKATLSENDKIASSEKIWIDNETAYPLKAEIYNSDGSVYMEIIFKNFTFK